MEHVDIVSLLKTKNKDTMTEDIILMFLATALLVLTIGSTSREHLTPQKGMTPQDSLDIVTGALKKNGPDGTFALFDTQLSNYEKLIAQDDNTE